MPPELDLPANFSEAPFVLAPATCRRWALFLDVDGTLTEIADHPDAAHIPADLTLLLHQLRDDLDGALALVSGRTLAALDRLFGPPMLPAAGLHGLERRSADGIVHRVGSSDILNGARTALSDFSRDRPGILIEDKGAAIALHYRTVPQFEDEARAFVRALVAGNKRLAMVPGKMVFEIKTAGADKGLAVSAFMAEAPFAGRIPVYVGDDITDEDAFVQVNRMAGLSIRVGGDGRTTAHQQLAGVADARRWLEALHAACRSEDSRP